MVRKSQYNIIEHLARAVLFSSYHENALMAMFSAYFDASGHPDQQSVITVAGFVSSVKKWTRFDSEWNAILKSEGVEYFRMSEFASNQGQFSHGWRRATDRRREFITRLAMCLRRNVNKSFRATLIMPDYVQVNQRFLLEEGLGRPYTLCAMLCSFNLRKWAKAKHAERKLLYFFEDGDKDKGDFEYHHKETYGEKPLFLPASKAVAFQAADFAGWKTRANVQQALKDDHDLEKGIRLMQSVAMLSKIPHAAGVIDWKGLSAHCALFKFPLRNPPINAPQVGGV